MVASLIGYFIAATARCRGQAGQGRIGGDQGQVADIRGVVKAVSVLLVSKLSIFFDSARVDSSSLCVSFLRRVFSVRGWAPRRWAAYLCVL